MSTILGMPNTADYLADTKIGGPALTDLSIDWVSPSDAAGVDTLQVWLTTKPGYGGGNLGSPQFVILQGSRILAACGLAVGQVVTFPKMTLSNPVNFAKGQPYTLRIFNGAEARDQNFCGLDSMYTNDWLAGNPFLSMENGQGIVSSRRGYNPCFALSGPNGVYIANNYMEVERSKVTRYGQQVFHPQTADATVVAIIKRNYSPLVLNVGGVAIPNGSQDSHHPYDDDLVLDEPFVWKAGTSLAVVVDGYMLPIRKGVESSAGSWPDPCPFMHGEVDTSAAQDGSQFGLIPGIAFDYQVCLVLQ